MVRNFPDSFARNVAVTLRAMGHEVLSIEGSRVRHNAHRLSNAFWKLLPEVFPFVEARAFRTSLQRMEEFSPALVLVTHDFFGAEQVEEMKRRTRVPVVCWFMDPIISIGRGRIFATQYDLFFFKEPMLVEVFGEKLGKPAEYLPEAFNRHSLRPIEVSPEQMRRYGCDIATQGTLHHYRAEFYDVFVGSEWEVKIWGNIAIPSVRNGSRRFLTGHYVTGGEKALAFRAARAVVNNMNYGEVRGVNQTLFEATGSGGFVLCDHKETVPELFVVGEEVVTFASRPELLEKLAYYLSPAGEGERLRIRERGAVRAHREHTFEHRLRVLLERTLGAS